MRLIRALNSWSTLRMPNAKMKTKKDDVWNYKNKLISETKHINNLDF